MKTLVLLPLIVLATACGGGEDTQGAQSPPPASATGPGLTVTEAVESELSGPLLVRGALVADGKHTRLCEALAESYPPQCAGASLSVAGADLVGLDLQREGEVSWAEQVKLLGTVEDGVLTVSPTATG